MTVHEMISRDEKHLLRALHHRHDAVVDVLEPVMGRMEPFFRAVTEFPYVDRLPTTRETVEQWFGFLDDVVKEEREFVLRVVDLLPERRVTTPVPRETRKTTTTAA